MLSITPLMTLYGDVCVTYGTLSLSYFALSKNTPFSYHCEVWKRIAFGLIAGFAVLFLNYDRLSLTDDIFFSFEMIPMILATFYGGWISGITCYAVNFFLSDPFTLNNFFIATIMIPLFMGRVWLHKTNRVFYSTIITIAIYRMLLLLSQNDLQVSWWAIIFYQLVTIICVAICFHALNFKERHINAYFSMRKRATIDSLTQINNRASIDYKLAILHANHRACGLLILDIDNFKKVNDTYGHLIGDRLLTAIGGILNENIRGEDFAGRYGGEEFLVVTASDNASTILAMAERLRSVVAETRVPLEGSATLAVTVSIGVSIYSPGMEMKKALAAADEALYRAKRQGKNRVISSKGMEKQHVD